MTKLLTIAARHDAPVACDLTNAEDTLAERLAEYRRLFGHALLGRESTEGTTTFRFAIRPGVREWVLDLVRREAACCPFLSYEVDLEGDEVVWVARGLSTADVAAFDDVVAEADATSASSIALAHRLTERGGVPVPTAG